MQLARTFVASTGGLQAVLRGTAQRLAAALSTRGTLPLRSPLPASRLLWCPWARRHVGAGEATPEAEDLVPVGTSPRPAAGHPRPSACLEPRHESGPLHTTAASWHVLQIVASGGPRGWAPSEPATLGWSASGRVHGGDGSAGNWHPGV